MSAGTDWRSCEIVRLRAEVERLREEKAGLREELREARKMPVLNAPTVVGVAVLSMLAALQTCEWKSASPDISGKRGAVSAPQMHGTGPTGAISGPESLA